MSAPTIPVSIAKGAKAWLYGQLQAAFEGWTCDTGAPLMVSYDEPGKNQPNDIVAVRSLKRRLDAGGMVGSMGAGAVYDTVELDVVASVFRGGDIAQACFERACDLVDVIVSVVRADPSMGGLVTVARVADIDIPEAGWTENHAGRLTEAVVTVTASAFI